MHSIRKAIASDAQAVFDVRIAAIRSQAAGYYPDDIIERWTSGDAPSDGFTQFVEDVCHVIEIEGEIVATGAVDLFSGKIDAIFVRPQNFRQGLASAMMGYLETKALDASLTALYLEYTLNAESFYLSLGFAGAGKSQYHSPRGFSMDCVVMQKELKITLPNPQV